MTTIYNIGPFRLDSEAGVLMKAGAPTALGSLAVARSWPRRSNERLFPGAAARIHQ
jgi:hypothetical protein